MEGSTLRGQGRRKTYEVMPRRKDAKEPRRKEVGECTSKTTNLAAALVFITRESKGRKRPWKRRKIRKKKKKGGSGEWTWRRGGERVVERGRSRWKGQEVRGRVGFHKGVFEETLLFQESETSCVWARKRSSLLFPLWLF